MQMITEGAVQRRGRARNASGSVDRSHRNSHRLFGIQARLIFIQQQVFGRYFGHIHGNDQLGLTFHTVVGDDQHIGAEHSDCLLSGSARVASKYAFKFHDVISSSI